jgi:flagellin-like hook-associated protein FlgL
MTISGVSANLAPLIQSALDINKKLDDLQTQLGSGQKSTTYAGLGSQSGIAVALSAQLAALGSFDDTMTNAGTTISLQQLVLQQIASIGNTVQSSAGLPNYAIDGTGQTTVQKSAASQLDQVLSLLNTQGGNGYLFSGSGLNLTSVDTSDHILNGNGAQAGLKQVIAERNQADLGADGLGRLVIPAAAGATVSVSEDVAGSPYGLKLAAVNSTLTGATVTGPTGSPAAISVDLGATNPSNGDSVTYTFTLPDGTSQTLKLQATTSSPPGPNQFTIGATPADTATNLQAALTAGVSQIGSTSLSAASAMAASNDFFDDPPQRVSGSPATATAQVDGTSANTVIWYTGEDGSGSARSTATARIDPTTTVSFGTRANEQGIRWIVQNIAALAATSYSSSDPNAVNSYAALNQRVYAALGVPAGVQNISDIETSLANAQSAMKTTQSQHQQTANMLTNLQQSIEGIDTTTVGAQILSLQTSLSASLSATARLSSINLLAYLSPVSG